jgi:predicted AlkP superfamily pyrophosphatase or phosphodiesterase
MNKHVILLNVVGLAPKHLDRPDLAPNLCALAKRGKAHRLRPSFPAVTCSMQATLLSGKPPSEHGIIANGYFDRETFEVKFWEQPAALVQAPRLWDLVKTADPSAKTAVLFWQNSMFINSDIVVTPRPLHLDSGMVQWCYSKPAGYYEELAGEIGDFKLQQYWGPVAGLGSSEWIAKAARVTWRKHRPNLMTVYLPHMDYAAQKHGPDSEAAQQSLKEVDGLVGGMLEDFKGATVVVCSEYSLSPVSGAVFPNRVLRQAGLLRVREIAGREYLDFELSDAFAMVDHQVAHIYCKPGKVTAAKEALAGAHPLDWTTVGHERAGELVAVAPEGRWFAYYWWEDWAKAPEFAHFVDIHRKPGYDPCELFFNWGRMARTFKPSTGIEPGMVKGSHGRAPANDADANHWATLILDETAANVAELDSIVDATEVAGIVMELLAG